ncbi:B12-binding domain-containing radical SAM protein [Nanoarchaeota archaeon]
MKVLVVNPPNEPYSEKSLLIEPIDVLGLATYIKSLNHEVQLIDMDVKQTSPETMVNTIKSFMPKITIIPFDYHIPLHTSAAIPNINKIGKIANFYGSKVIVGGKSSKYHPSEFLNYNIDVLINGEMEITISELLNLEDWSLKNLAKVKEISYNHEGTINTTEKRSDKIKVNSLPIPDRNLINMADYIDVRSMLSSRGCFGKCSFCPNTDFWGNWRGRSPENVVDEIEYLVNEFDAKKILFLDDNATVNKDRMKNISDEIIKRNIKTTLGCLGTVQTYDKETIKKMQKAGFRWIHYGAESGNDKILYENSKNINSDQIKKAIIETKDAGLRVRTSWIFDLPGTDENAIQDTIDLILETEPEEIRAHYLALRAGTELYTRTFRGQSIPSQYIHNNQPSLNLSSYDHEKITEKVDELTNEFQNRGYLVITSPSEWRDVEKLKKIDPQLRFISFCPSRYGLGWER